MNTNKLPDDIIRHIIPFTYRPQKQELLNEIRHYQRKKTVIKNGLFNYRIISLMGGMATITYR